VGGYDLKAAVQLGELPPRERGISLCTQKETRRDVRMRKGLLKKKPHRIRRRTEEKKSAKGRRV